MPDVAADMAVPLPFKSPVIVVVSVIAGVVVAVATVPANPLAETTDAEVTVPDGVVTLPPKLIGDPLIVMELLAN